MDASPIRPTIRFPPLHPCHRCKGTFIRSIFYKSGRYSEMLLCPSLIKRSLHCSYLYLLYGWGIGPIEEKPNENDPEHSDHERNISHEASAHRNHLRNQAFLCLAKVSREHLLIFCAPHKVQSLATNKYQQELFLAIISFSPCPRLRVQNRSSCMF